MTLIFAAVIGLTAFVLGTVLARRAARKEQTRLRARLTDLCKEVSVLSKLSRGVQLLARSMMTEDQRAVVDEVLSGANESLRVKYNIPAGNYRIETL